MNSDGKVQLVLANVPGNLLVPMVSMNYFDIPPWNRRVNDYIVAIFDFVEKFLAFNGVMLLCHSNDLKVLREVRSYLESYGF